MDASVALAWCFPDEISDYADGILVSLKGKTVLVPAVWSLEIANAVLSGERRKLLQSREIREFTTLLQSLSLLEHLRPITDCMNDILSLARAHSLSAYAAAYLELSMRRDAPLATLDGKLQKAAKRAGAVLFANSAPYSVK